MKKIIYVSMPSNEHPSLDSIERLRQQAAQQFSALTARLGFTDKTGRPISIQVQIEAFNPHSKYFYNASASRLGESEYQVLIGGGLLARLEVLGEAAAADKSVLRGSTRSILLGKQVRSDGRRKAIADFSFHYLLNIIFWHEVAHIVLGHVDWLSKEFKATELDELLMIQIDETEAAARRVLEGDADRQASVWTLAIFDSSLDNNPFLRYQSKTDAFYDFGYLVGLLFSMFAALSNEKTLANQQTHPNAHERIGVVLAFSEDYFKLRYSDAKSILQQSVVRGALQALNDIHHENRKPINALEMIGFTAKNGERIESLGVRDSQLVPESQLGSSFDLSSVA